MLKQQTPDERARLALLRCLATEAFQQLDHGQGVKISGEEQLARFIGCIGRRAATSVKRRSGKK
jgi:hypothetical protein